MIELKVPEYLRDEYEQCGALAVIAASRARGYIERIGRVESTLALRTHELAEMTRMHANAVKEAKIAEAEIATLRQTVEQDRDWYNHQIEIVNKRNSQLEVQLAALRRPVTDEECRAFENSYGEKLMLNYVEWGLSEFLESRARTEASSS